MINKTKQMNDKWIVHLFNLYNFVCQLLAPNFVTYKWVNCPSLWRGQLTALRLTKSSKTVNHAYCPQNLSDCTISKLQAQP